MFAPARGWRTWLKKAIVRGAVAGCALYVVAMATLVVDGLTDSATTSDVAVVLGNQVTDDGVPSDRLAARLDKAAELYHGDVVPAIIVSGGVGESGFDEALVMGDYLVEQGVPDRAVLIDGAGRTTRETAENTARTMEDQGWSSAIVVTQYFHISRSRMALQQEGVESVTTAHAEHVEPRDAYSLVREVPAYAKYLIGR